MSPKSDLIGLVSRELPAKAAAFEPMSANLERVWPTGHYVAFWASRGGRTNMIRNDYICTTLGEFVSV